MALPGLLIEYLIAGALAALWVLGIFPEWLTRIDRSYLPIVAVYLYAIGMLVDFAAYSLLLWPKRVLRRHTANRLGIGYPMPPASTQARNAKFALYAPELAREVALRGSRDRIARDIALNLLLSAIVWQSHVPLWAGLLLTLVAGAMWAFFETNSFSFELRAEQALDAKLSTHQGAGAAS